MRRTRRSIRTSATRWSPRVEPLESRRLFAVSISAGLPGGSSLVPADVSTISTDASTDLSTLSVIATDPADQAVLTQSPTVLNITFNQPFDSLTVGSDIDLQQVDASGNVLADDGGMLTEPFTLTAPSQTLSVAVSGALAPGYYQIVLTGSVSYLSGVSQDGNLGAPLANAGTDVTLATFQIATPTPPTPQGPTFASATDLGTAGQQIVSANGSLDLQANVGDYQLYKFTLAAGHFWQLGAEVDAQRNGGTLNSALALFDAQGNLLKTDDVGRPDDPFDPYLFSGLQPGTYYLGVSGSKDLPNVTGGYNPAAGLFGTVGLAQQGGPYDIRVQAVPQDTPTRLLTAQLNYADPLNPQPTGVTLVFSRPMDVNSFVDAIQNNGWDGLEVRDEAGRLWPLTPLAYQESNSQFTFLFSEPLPQGHYTLVEPAQGGVTDLAGQPPVANSAAGPQAVPGVLATWDVGAAAPSWNPHDLGTIMGNATDSPTRSTTIAPGETVTYRFVTPAAGTYDFSALSSGGPMTITALGDSGQVTQETASSGTSADGLMQLQCGVYYVQFTNSGTQSISASFTVYRQSVSAEAVFDNGVGQGPALNLALIRPGAESISDSTPWPTSVIPGPEPFTSASDATATASAAAHAGTASSPVAFESASGTSGLVLTLGSSLVGTPVAGADHVGAVGPGTQTGATAVASSAPGVMQGITYGQSLGASSTALSSSSGSSSDPAAPLAVAAEAQVFEDGALVVVPKPTEPDMDRSVLASARTWLGDVSASVLNWFGASAPTTVPAEPATVEPWSIARPAVADRIMLVRDDQPRRSDETLEHHADLTTPLGLSMVSVLVLRLQQPVRRWAQGRNGSRLRRSVASPAGRGPHARV